MELLPAQVQMFHSSIQVCIVGTEIWTILSYLVEKYQARIATVRVILLGSRHQAHMEPALNVMMQQDNSNQPRRAHLFGLVQLNRSNIQQCNYRILRRSLGLSDL